MVGGLPAGLDGLEKQFLNCLAERRFDSFMGLQYNKIDSYCRRRKGNAKIIQLVFDWLSNSVLGNLPGE